MKTITIYSVTGEFAENKDAARDMRVQEITPALQQGNGVVLDFTGVDGATQSFIHALISELFREYGPELLDILKFKGCNEKVQKVIEIVAEYMQES